ncbi:hypothetical protein, conserved [Babesia bigemina]|uniref:C3H1-type domain-containing protein n=1 Tax=Babesia bigemina TaxID=5866 RepID=A0A061BJT6_BABBI|nr:hypothetical protein, conserved [Babesia bigemina]CDR71760.1 hypothetical protein, conserved [Babesia bigemina]|eukprot:XP_012770705.1 hypothetical protein, conserved [Babesia bigemina]
MGFLHGVLEAVKEDDAVKTYDKYMDRKLNTVLEEVNKNIGSGRNGLAASVGAVRGWLEGYEGVLTTNTKNLRNAYITLRDFNFLKISDALSSLKKLRGDDIAKVADIIDRCITEAGNLSKDFTLAKVAYTKLDTSLRNRLRDTARRLEVEVARFVAAASNSELKAVVHLTGRELEVLQSTVNSHAKGCLHIMESKMNEEFNEKITQKIAGINDELKQHIIMLDRWIAAAQNVVEQAIKKCDEILGKIKENDENTLQTTEIGKAVEKLKGEAIKLLSSATEAKRSVQSLVPAALKKVEEMDTAVEYGLFQIKEQLMTGLYKYVSAYVAEVQRQVGLIKGKRGGDDGKGIEGIKKKVQGYMNQYKTFESLVQHWINDILTDNGIVKESLGTYVSKSGQHRFNPDDITNRNGFHLTNSNKVAAAIKEQLTLLGIEMGNAGIEDDGEDNIQNNIMAVHNCVTGFVMHLNAKLDKGKPLSGDRDRFVESIATAIEKAVVVGGDGAAFRSHLKPVVTNVLAALYTKTNQILTELESLVGVEHEVKIGDNLDDALGVSNNLVEGFTEAIKNPSETSSATFFNPYDAGSTIKLKDNILKTISEALIKQIGKENNHGRVNLEGVSNFALYRTSVTVPTDGKLTGIKDKKEGTLPEAIGDIKTEVEKALQNVQPHPSVGAIREVKDATFTDQYNIVKRELQDLTKLVDEKNDSLISGENGKIGVKTLLRDIKRGLGNKRVWYFFPKGLTEIKERIHHLQNTALTELLTNADNFYNDVMQKLTGEAIDSIKAFVNKEIHRSTTTMREKAQHHYHNKISSLFHETKSRVTKYIIEMETMIDKDLQSGVKGLMRKLRMHLENDIQTKVISGNKISDVYKNIAAFSTKLHPLLSALLTYTNADLKKIDPNFTKLAKFAKPLEMPFAILADVAHFSSAFANTLSTLSSLSSALDPQALPDAGRPVLKALKQGMLGFVEELGKGYVSRYSMETFKEGLTDKKDTLTDYGRKCAKVCLSIVPIVTNSLSELKENLDDEDGKWKKYKIYNSDKSHHSLHRLFFRDNGYDIDLPVEAKHGELNHKDTILGEIILNKLNDPTYKLFATSKQPLGDQELTVDLVNEHGILEDLFDCLKKYFAVCHLGAPSKKHPCSVNEMLCWLTGLPHNGVYEKLKGYIHSVFMVPKKDNPSEKIYMPIDASPSPITEPSMVEVIGQVCAKSYALLTTFVGTGDEATYYACEFPNNSLGLQYPSNPADCLDTLLDILRRIFPPLKFLFMQCGQPASENGWLKCVYGKSVASSKWPCKEHSKGKARCEAKCQPTCGPTCQPNCRPTSPLQSYLSDSLTGHLPHALTSIGCRAECNTCPKGKPGMPCITPLGFRGFSGSTKTGSYLSSVIGEFLDIANIHTLFGLSPTTPKTLPEHFDFVSCLVRGWHNDKKYHKVGVQKAFEDSAGSLSIKLYNQPHELTDALRNAYSEPRPAQLNQVRMPPHAALSSLWLITPNDLSLKAYCAPYMSPLCGNAYGCLPFKHSNTYLSWAIYLPWTFWDLLNNLYNSFCSINCQDWGCRGCLRGDKCKMGAHGSIHETTKKSNCQCSSIVDCKGVAPTLYQYGFVFGEASTLNDKQSPKKCSDFCSQLKNVLKSKYFEKLFEECDNFLWTIRTPFSYLVLSLWLLSLLYLLHIMVIRLDLLHIKSHLHSPSSHRIAAQSLLAAGRVNKLNRVFYLQP